jgi:hypothetical protein
MIAAILWVVRFIIAYWVIRIILLMVRGASIKRPRDPGARNGPVQRFDTKGKNISEAEFKDV